MFYLYRYRDALHWKRKGILCVGACLITVDQDCAACIYDEVLKTVANSNANLEIAQKIQRGRMFVQEKMIWTTQNIIGDGRACFPQKIAKPNEIVRMNKSGNPDSTNNSLVHPEETLDNEALQATTRSGHNGRGQAKAQTVLTLARSQAERLLNICEIGYEIHISRNLEK